MFSNLFDLFFPKLCVGCKSSLLIQEETLCVSCIHDLPLTNFHHSKLQVLNTVFFGHVDFISATALLYFHKKGTVQELIHQLKYKNNEAIGLYLGRWLGSELKNIITYQNIDVVVPVPLHKKRLRQRGYNQVEKFGQIIASELKARYDDTVLTRIQNSKSQTFKSRLNRSQTITTVFKVFDLCALEGLHVLLVDDVITTGATIQSCAEQLKKIPNIKLSLAVMAYTE